jgi:ABC-type polar amino acid transport system ATPase subunit
MTETPATKFIAAILIVVAPFAMDAGRIVEENNPAEFFDNPQNERTKSFLASVLSHTD